MCDQCPVPSPVYAYCVLWACSQTVVHGMQVWNTNQGGSGVVGIFNVQVSLQPMHCRSVVLLASLHEYSAS